MALPEGYRLRAGDIVSLRATVKWDQEPNETRTNVQIEGAFAELTSIDLENVVLVQRAWKPGQKVVLHSSIPGRPKWEGPGTVIATFGDSVWVDVPSHYDVPGDRNPLTAHANDLVEWREEPPAYTPETGKKIWPENPPPAPGSSADIGDDEPF